MDMEQRRREIAGAAASLILARGFNETSMREIAAAAGIGKSTLYDYFISKDEIILFLVEDPVTELTNRALAILQQGGSAAERLRRVMHMHLDFLLEKKAYYLKLVLEIQRLSVETQQHYQVKRYAYQDLVQGLIEEGIQQGAFRPVNPGMAMKSLIAMMTPVVFTSRPIGTPQEMLDDALELFFGGLTLE
jgi:AcrR family transcriptional regulator